MDDSGCPSSGRQSGLQRGLEDPPPIPPQHAASVVKNAVKSHCTRGGKSVNLPLSGAAWINSKWAVLAVEVRWQRRQSSGSNAAVARQWRAAWQGHWQCKDDSGSAAAAGRCLQAHGSSSVAAMSGAEGWQEIGGSCYSRAVAAVAAWQWQRLHKGVSGSTETATGRQGQDANLAAAGQC
jgi:hypothetical protein